jgi:hypothetical protein
MTPAADIASAMDSAIAAPSDAADASQNVSDADTGLAAAWDVPRDSDGAATVSVNRFPATGACKIGGTYYGDCVAIAPDGDAVSSTVGACLP